MLFSELLEILTYGELSHLSISGNGEAIEPANYKRIASHTNLGLTAIYSRFPIREEEAVLQQYDAIYDYVLKSEYSLNSGSAQPVKYIIDTATKKFVDNVIRIARVYDDLGAEVPLNDEWDSTSYWTPDYRTLQIPVPDSTRNTSVIYQAKHDKLVVDAATDPDTIDINLSSVFYEALATFVAARVVSTIGEEGPSESANLSAKYEFLVRQIETNGSYNKDSHKYDRIVAGGWK